MREPHDFQASTAGFKTKSMLRCKPRAVQARYVVYEDEGHDLALEPSKMWYSKLQGYATRLPIGGTP